MKQPRYFLAFSKLTGAPYPGFPVGLGGFRGLHAAFLIESRTRGHLPKPRGRKSGSFAQFCEGWDATIAKVRSARRLTMIESLKVQKCGIPPFANNAKY